MGGWQIEAPSWRETTRWRLYAIERSKEVIVQYSGIRGTGKPERVLMAFMRTIDEYKMTL